ncbi:MAG TPA: hypothetical protein VF003_11765 [Pseudonocardiaceae bacterium]
MGGPSDEGTCDGGAATRADFLRRLNRTTEARTAYEEALLLTDNSTERDFLTSRLHQLDPGAPEHPREHA